MPIAWRAPATSAYPGRYLSLGRRPGWDMLESNPLKADLDLSRASGWRLCGEKGTDP
jgi:hypothetical protein